MSIFNLEFIYNYFAESARTKYVDNEIKLSKEARKNKNNAEALIHAQNAAVYTDLENDEAIKNGKYIDPHKNDRSKETIDKLRKGKNLFNYDSLDEPKERSEKVEYAKKGYGLGHNKRRIKYAVLSKRK